jgi:hypothetical protein
MAEGGLVTEKLGNAVGDSQIGQYLMTDGSIGRGITPALKNKD